ncbi:alpha/beta-hydrolase [Delitschia confertaspora ATCC 74209]|uniref:Alpha/beta-hydrolase n=1 Tax=Delitschia confertaspora ATCC 74209 TaxID=1513339 RepID=A0A9P4JU13_9PLEO|nr:alpha/beta-hydrolase [Delitschia confertaspora ATCC 74209]
MPFGPFILQWRAPSPNPPLPTPLPEGLSRTYINTSSGPLELLSAIPDPRVINKSLPLLFFAHGGFGCAEVWTFWMLYFSARGYPCYAVSYRGHGKSWYPGYLSMLITGRGALGADFVAGIREAERMERERRRVEEDVNVILVAHSSGGSLAQYVLGQGLVKVWALCLAASVPGFGSASVYKFWLPIVPFHAPFRLFHPRYPLATPHMIKAAFFSSQMPISEVRHFDRLLSPYESLLWPIQMIPPVATGIDILRGITGWGWQTGKLSSSSAASSENNFVGNRDVGDRPKSAQKSEFNEYLFILAAERDVLCHPPILYSMMQKYQGALADFVQEDSALPAKNGGGSSCGDGGVRFRIVPGVAHHLQNDVEWQRGAQEILEWLRGLE